MTYIFNLLTWCGYVHVTAPTPEQAREAKMLDESYDSEEEILAVIQHPDFHKSYPALAGITKI